MIAIASKVIAAGAQTAPDAGAKAPTIPGTGIPFDPGFGIGGLAYASLFAIAVAVAALSARVLFMAKRDRERGYAWALPFEAHLIAWFFDKTGFALVERVLYGGIPGVDESRCAMRLDGDRVERLAFPDEDRAVAWLLS